MKIRLSWSLLLAFTLLTVPAQAWDQKGHRVVAAVAWEHMDAQARTKAVAILRGAPGDADLLAEERGRRCRRRRGIGRFSCGRRRGPTSCGIALMRRGGRSIITRRDIT